MGQVSGGTGPCHVCGTPVKLLRHSNRHQFDVGRCPECGCVSVIDAEQVVARRQAPENESRDIDWAGYESVMRQSDDYYRQTLEDLLPRIKTGADKPLLFDVGAGSGSFLDMARGYGFAVTGNEVSEASFEYAKEKYEIELSREFLDAQPRNWVDAMTMWCVVAHVGDPRGFLKDAFDMLKPGGTLFLRTPRWCLLDTVGVLLSRLSRGRFDKIADKRVNNGHLHLYSDRALETLLKDVGFTTVHLDRISHFGLKSDMLARFVGGPQWLQRILTRVIEFALTKQWAPRNTVFAYATRS